MNEMELQVLDWIQAHLQCGFLDAVVPKVSMLADAGAVWILLALVLLAMPRTRKLGAAVTAALVLEVLLCNVLIKPIVARPRPYTYRELTLLVKALRDYSFPSAHTAASFAAAGALCFSGAKKRLWIPAMVLALVIGLTRLYLYVHFPTDVLGGVVMGLLCGWGSARIVKKGCKLCKKSEK